MPSSSLKVKLPSIDKPIIKKQSSFVGKKSSTPKKIVTNKDAYKRQ